MMRSGITKHRRRGRHGRLSSPSLPLSRSLADCSNHRRRDSCRAFSSFSLDTLLLALQMNGRFSILFLPLSLHVIPPRNRPGDRSRLPALASPVARSSVEETREAPLPPTGTRGPRRPRDRPRHAARPSRFTSIIVKEVPRERSSLRVALSPFPVVLTTCSLRSRES